MRVATFPSKSNPGVEYDLYFDNRGYYCTCPGFQFSKSRPKTCRHVTEYSERVAQQAPSIPSTDPAQLDNPSDADQPRDFSKWSMQDEINAQWEYILQRKYRRKW